MMTGRASEIYLWEILRQGTKPERAKLLGMLRGSGNEQVFTSTSAKHSEELFLRGVFYFSFGANKATWHLKLHLGICRYYKGHPNYLQRHLKDIWG